MKDPDNGKGIIFKKKRREGSKLPTFEGKITVDGKVRKIVGWDSTTRNDGTMYINLKLSEEE